MGFGLGLATSTSPIPPYQMRLRATTTLPLLRVGGDVATLLVSRGDARLPLLLLLAVVVVAVVVVVLWSQRLCFKDVRAGRYKQDMFRFGLSFFTSTGPNQTCLNFPR